MESGSESESDGEGRKSVWFNNSLYDTWQQAKDAYVKLSANAKGPNSVWHKVAIFEDQTADTFELRCKTCNSICQLRNVAKWNKAHSSEKCAKIASKNKKGPKAAAAGGIANFAASEQQQTAFVDGLVKAMATGCIPFNFMENQHLQDAAAAVGVKLPSRKVVAGPLLDKIFEETQTFSAELLAGMDYPAGSSDGWRKKHCEQGAGLMNFMVLGDQGVPFYQRSLLSHGAVPQCLLNPPIRARTHAEALLYDVRNCSDLRKDAEGIKDLLFEVGTAIMGGEENAAGFAGWVLDNTRSNRAAMRLLEIARPEWALVGCVAHGSALAMKDTCKYGKTKGRHSVEWGVEWLAACNDEANTVANYINDSSPAKSLLRKYQMETYGGPRQITVSVPTRFATNLFVMESVQRSKAAFNQAIADKKWDDLGGKSVQV